MQANNSTYRIEKLKQELEAANQDKEYMSQCLDSYT